MKKLISILNKKHKKGFTLVEVIVVLIIIAIMAAILLPSLTGYIDKAKEKALISEARQFMQGFQSALCETYAFKKIDTSIKYKDPDFPGVKVGKTTNYTFYRIKAKNPPRPSEASSFDYVMSEIAYDLVDGEGFTYQQANSDKAKVRSDDVVLYQVTYSADAQILKFEYGRSGVYVKYIDGVYTCTIDGTFTDYKE